MQGHVVRDPLWPRPTFWPKGFSSFGHDLWPRPIFTYCGHDLFWPRPTLAKPTLAKRIGPTVAPKKRRKKEKMKGATGPKGWERVPTGWGPEGWEPKPRKSGGRKGGRGSNGEGPKFRAFFPLPLYFRLFFSLGGLLVELWPRVAAMDHPKRAIWVVHRVGRGHSRSCLARKTFQVSGRGDWQRL